MVGIDVSKSTLACTRVDPISRETVWQKTVTNDTNGILRLLSFSDPSDPFVLEPTGRYSLPFAKAAKAQERVVYLAEPKKAKMYLSSLPVRAKTDLLDSLGLALYGLSCRLPPYPVKDEAVEALDQMLKARKSLSISRMRLEQQACEMPYAKDSLRAAAEAISQEMLALDKLIKAHLRSDERFSVIALLQSVPGVGPVTAASVASCLVAREFADPDQFVAFIGLDPVTKQSGQSDHRGALSKRGDPELRRLLYLAAQTNLRLADSPYREIYQRHRDRGLPTTAALCAVARKIARTCWSIARYNQPFDKARVLAKPPRPLDTLT